MIDLTSGIRCLPFKPADKLVLQPGSFELFPLCAAYTFLAPLCVHDYTAAFTVHSDVGTGLRYRCKGDRTITRLGAFRNGVTTTDH